MEEDINLLAMDVYNEQNKELTEYYMRQQDVKSKKLVQYNKRVMIRSISQLPKNIGRNNEI